MGEGRASIRLVAFGVVLGLVATACGARLTDEQRAAGLGALGSGGSGPGGTDGFVDGGIGDGFVDGDFGGTDGIDGSFPGAGQGTGAGAGPGASGPRTASDVGVTPSTIRIATIADVSGVQPGLFKSAHQAVQAAVAMANSQGGVLGRQLELLQLDSKVDAGGTRTAVLEACDKAFALVGSMSAFDDGGARAVDDCGIPDLTAITVSQARSTNRFTYPIFPNGSGDFVVASGNMMKEQFPNAVTKAAQLWLNTSTTRFNAETKRKAYESVGFNFIYTEETQVVEANYTPFVQKMKDQGVEFVTMLSDYQSIVRLVRAMRQQNWRPQVLEWDSVVYSPRFLQEAEGAAEGSFVYLNSAMLEEVDQNPEMQLYMQWLGAVAPGAQPDYFGLYAWSAARLFVEVASAVGVELTRDAFMTEVKKVRSWGGNGLHAEHNVGARTPSRCMMFAKIQNDRFVRHKPASGWACNKGGLYKAL